MTHMTYGDAIRNAIYHEMEKDNNIVFMGEDIRYNLYAYSEGLLDRFGPQRVLDVPLSEATITGTAIGASMCGLRMILDLTMASFLYVAMDQIVNMAAKTRYQYDGQFRLPLTIMASYAYAASAGAQHSDRLHSMLMNVPGLKIVVPTCPSDAYGLLRTAIQDDNPVMFFMDKTVFYESEEVNVKQKIEIGDARKRRTGTDVTIVQVTACNNIFNDVVEWGRKSNISIEIIDVRTLVPLDIDMIIKSVMKTGRLVVVDSSNRTCSAAEHISSIVYEKAFHYLKAPIEIVATEDVHLPFCPILEHELVPTVHKVIDKIEKVMKT